MMWGNHLDSFSWRIDVKTKARNLEQLNQPTAIMEMKVKSQMQRQQVSTRVYISLPWLVHVCAYHYPLATMVSTRHYPLATMVSTRHYPLATMVSTRVCMSLPASHHG
jgi:hypothetical protein